MSRTLTSTLTFSDFLQANTWKPSSADVQQPHTAPCTAVRVLMEGQWPTRWNKQDRHQIALCKNNIAYPDLLIMVIKKFRGECRNKKSKQSVNNKQLNFAFSPLSDIFKQRLFFKTPVRSYPASFWYTFRQLKGRVLETRTSGFAFLHQQPGLLYWIIFFCCLLKSCDLSI